MRKIIFLLSLIGLFVLTACSESKYVIDDATVVNKGYNAQSGWYFVTVEKNDSKYTFHVFQSEYDLAENGAVVDVEKYDGKNFARIYPSERISKDSK